MNLQLPLVVSDITGVTGLRILRDIVAGQRDPVCLAQHRDYRCRATEAAIVAALTGNYRTEQGDEVRELVENGLMNRDGRRFGSRPDGIKSGGLFETLQDFVDSSDEPVAEARTLLLIPERRGTDFCASFRMEFDAHDDRRALSGSPRVRLSTARATSALPEPRPIDEGVHQPRRLQLPRPLPRDSTTIPQRYERVPHATTEAPRRADRPSTSSSVYFGSSEYG
jgi:hypothetical protein